MNSFSVFLSEMFFISSSILNDNNTGQIIILQVSFLFTFQHTEYIMPLPSGLQIFCKKSADSLMRILLHMILCFYLASFRILFLTFTNFNYDVSSCGYVWVHLGWDPLCFLYLDICFLLQVWEVFNHKFIKYIFDPFLSPCPSVTSVI